jgi:hypothetical protein
LAKGVVLDDFPARPEDGKDLNSHDGDGEPVTGGQFMSCVKGLSRTIEEESSMR